MTARTVCDNGLRRLGAGSTIALTAALFCSAMPVQAQVNLSITKAQSGDFRAGATNPSTPQFFCSDISPQFSNALFYGGPPSPATIPNNCVNTITIWVVNKGTAATAGPGGNAVVVTELLSPEQPKSSTVLSTNGYCAFPAGCSTGVVNLGGTPTPPANGWACLVSQGRVTCARNDALPAGRSYPPIVIRF